VAHPDFQGASLFAAQSITVLAGTARRDFPLHGSYAHAASADNHVAYSVAAPDGRSFEVVRALGNNLWQQEVMTVPWADTLPVAGVSADSQPVLLATLFNADATLLIALAPSDGRYTVYNAASGSARLVGSGAWCAGDGAGTTDDADFHSLAWDEGLQVFYLGHKLGRVYAVDPRAACVDWTSAATAALATADAINRISVYHPGQLGITQHSGLLTVMTYAGGSFGGQLESYESQCALPLGSLPIGANHLLVYCATEFLSGNDANTQSDPQKLTIDPYRYILINKLDGQLTNYIYDGRNNAGVAIDAEAGKLYRVREGAFGRFDNLDLISGRVTEHQGLFVTDLLNHR
jgi:hypothetical protein